MVINLSKGQKVDLNDNLLDVNNICAYLFYDVSDADMNFDIDFSAFMVGPDGNSDILI